MVRILVALLLSAAAWGQAAGDPGKAQSSSSSTTASTAAGEHSAGSTDALGSARALLKSGKYEDAAAAFQVILGKDPAAAEAHAGLMRSLLRLRKINEAEDAGKKAVAALPQSALMHAWLGNVEFRAGKFGEAEQEFKNSLKLDGNTARAWYGMGRIYEMVSMNKHAQDACTNAHALDPDDDDIYRRWFDTLSYAEQLESFKKRVGNHPTENEKNRLQLLSAVVEKKPWILASPFKPEEVKLEPYGRKLVGVEDIDRDGPVHISKGFGLQVKFNGRAQAVLLLDTGAGGIIIGNKLAEKAGVVKIADTYVWGFGDEGAVRSYIGWVDKINIGGLEFHNCIVEVSSKNSVADEAGLIGPDIFRQFLITLDWKERKMLLAPLPKNPAFHGSDDDPQDRYIAPEMQSFTKVYRFGHDLVVPVVVSNKVLGNFVLDTGSEINIVGDKLADQVTKTSYQGYSMTGVSGRVKRVLTGDKAILQFAKMRIRSDDLPVVDLESMSAGEGTEIAGYIGIRTLVQMKMTIDYRDGLVNLAVYEFKKARD
ncbi:MAG TPA: aspartyl protease family protein [Candidatus Limnocylindrales bacterium]|nr:aspartyl protease family protein [Candidatus Limnocylindrales bacterium]